MGNKRGGFGSNFGFIMAAVGLGNIWGFPYKMGANGGFTFCLKFLVPVIMVLVLLGQLNDFLGLGLY